MKPKRRRAPLPRLTHLDRARRRNAERVNYGVVLAWGLLAAVGFAWAAGYAVRWPARALVIFAAIVICAGRR